MILLLVLALGVRVGLIAAAYRARAETWYTPDSWGYVDLAQNLADKGEFTQWRSPEVFRTPGYPVFLAVFEGLGESRRVLAILFVQALLGTATVYLTVRLGRELGGWRVGLLAGAFQAVTPVAVAAGCRVLTETPYTFLFVGSLWAVVRHLRGGSWRSLILSAVLLATACYVRPSGLAMAGVYGLVLLLSRSPGRRPWLRCLARSVVFAVLLAAAVVPWVVRNAVRADYAGFSSFASDSLFRYHGAYGLAFNEGMNVEDAQAELDAWDVEARRNDETVGAGIRRRSNRAWQLVEPGQFAWVQAKGAIGFSLPGATDVLELAGVSQGQRGTLAVLNEKGPMAAARHYFGDGRMAMLLAVPLGLIFLVKALGVVICAIAKVRPRMSAERWLLVGIVLVSALAGGPASTPRFRVPVEPILSIAAAGGWIAMVGAIRRRAKRGA